MQFRHGDSQVLNCLESHPHLPLTMATSGAALGCRVQGLRFKCQWYVHDLRHAVRVMVMVSVRVRVAAKGSQGCWERAACRQRLSCLVVAVAKDRLRSRVESALAFSWHTSMGPGRRMDCRKQSTLHDGSAVRVAL